MKLLASLALLVAAPALAAEPVLVPDFTPDTTSEFALGFMLQAKVFEVLSAQGYTVIDGAAAERAVGASLEACADMPQCPSAFMGALPARIAVVVRVERRGTDVVGVVDMHTTGEAEPVDSWEIPVHPGLEGQFAQGVLGATSTLSMRLGAVPAGMVASAEALVAQGDLAAAPSTELGAEDDGRRRYALGSIRQLELSEMDLESWSKEVRSHAGRFVLEVAGGIGAGDVSRAADVHVDVDENINVDLSWFQEGPTTGVAPRLSVAFGYAPLTWLEPSVALGIQLGRRGVDTSWSLVGEVQEEGSAEGGAVMLHVVPRLRFYMPPTGVAKPFLIVGTELRAFDAYEIASTSFAYPEPPGGLVVGPMAGLGWLVDPVRAVGFLLEGTFTYHVGLRAGPAEDGRPAIPRPEVDNHLGFTVGLGGAVQVRL